MQLRSRFNRPFYRSTARRYLEVSPFDLHCNGTTKTIRFLAPSPNIVGHRDHARFDPGWIDQILREGRLRPRRFSLSVGLNRTIVPAARDFKVPMACFAEPRLQELAGLASQIRACANAVRVGGRLAVRIRNEQFLGLSDFGANRKWEGVRKRAPWLAAVMTRRACRRAVPDHGPSACSSRGASETRSYDRV
jgi:hypothetical protein